jgi:hypothetical protein
VLDSYKRRSLAFWEFVILYVFVIFYVSVRFLAPLCRMVFPPMSNGTTDLKMGGNLVRPSYIFQSVVIQYNDTNLRPLSSRLLGTKYWDITVWNNCSSNGKFAVNNKMLCIFYSELRRRRHVDLFNCVEYFLFCQGML